MTSGRVSTVGGLSLSTWVMSVSMTGSSTRASRLGGHRADRDRAVTPARDLVPHGGFTPARSDPLCASSTRAGWNPLTSGFGCHRRPLYPLTGRSLSGRVGVSLVTRVTRPVTVNSRTNSGLRPATPAHVYGSKKKSREIHAKRELKDTPTCTRYLTHDIIVKRLSMEGYLKCTCR